MFKKNINRNVSRKIPIENGALSFLFLSVVSCGHMSSYVIHPNVLTRYLYNGYVGKQPVVWKEYCAVHWLKELQENMDRCTGDRDIIDILMKTALNTIQSTNQS